VAPFDEDQLARFMRNWHRVERGAKGLSKAEAEARADDLIGRLQSRPDVRRLAERPLHASLIASLNLRGNRLPEDRCQLYEEIIDLLLVRWRSGESAFRDRNGRVMDLPESATRPCLEELAYQAHDAQRESRDSRDAADISREMLEQAFSPVLDHYGRLDLLDYLRRHAGILIGKEEERFAFPHRAFQEYLAMRRLDARTELGNLPHGSSASGTGIIRA
jgi:predicted NACHT family NTPase